MDTSSGLRPRMRIFPIVSRRNSFFPLQYTDSCNSVQVLLRKTLGYLCGGGVNAPHPKPNKEAMVVAFPERHLLRLAHSALELSPCAVRCSRDQMRRHTIYLPAS